MNLIAVRYDLEFFDDWDQILIDDDIDARLAGGEDILVVAQAQIDRWGNEEGRKVTKAMLADDLDEFLRKNACLANSGRVGQLVERLVSITEGADIQLFPRFDKEPSVPSNGMR